MISRASEVPIQLDATKAATALLEAIVGKLDELLAQRSGPVQRFFSVADAARYSGLSTDSVRRLLERRDLTAYRPVKGRLLIDREQLDRLILSSTGRPINGRGIRPKGRINAQRCT